MLGSRLYAVDKNKMEGRYAEPWVVWAVPNLSSKNLGEVTATCIVCELYKGMYLQNITSLHKKQLAHTQYNRTIMMF